MTISSINQVRTISLPLTANQGSSILEVYATNQLVVGSDFVPGYKIVGFNCFLKNLKAFASLQSLEEAPLPDFQLGDSDTEKLIKTLDVEWKSPRKQLNLYISSSDNWLLVGSVSMLNPYGYPFRVYNLMDLLTDNLAAELGENSKIGVQIQDVGYGLLTDSDRVTIHGSYTEEFFLESPDPQTYITVPVTIPPITINVTGGTGNTGGGSLPPTPTYLVSNDNYIDNSFLVSN